MKHFELGIKRKKVITNPGKGCLVDFCSSNDEDNTCFTLDMCNGSDTTACMGADWCDTDNNSRCIAWDDCNTDNDNSCYLVDNCDCDGDLSWVVCSDIKQFLC